MCTSVCRAGSWLPATRVKCAGEKRRNNQLVSNPVSCRLPLKRSKVSVGSHAFIMEKKKKKTVSEFHL